MGQGAWVFVVVLVGLLVAATAASLAKDSPGPVLVFGISGLLFGLSVRLLLPRLQFDHAQGVLRTRRWATPAPYTTIAGVRVWSAKSGAWADIIGVDGRRLARMALANTWFAAPDARQWDALRHALRTAAAAGPAGTTRPPRGHRPEVPVGEALRILDAQVAWGLAGGRPDRHAPWRTLHSTTVVVR